MIAAGEAHLDTALHGLDEGLSTLGLILPLQQLAIAVELQRARYDAALARLDQIVVAVPRPETWLARRGEILAQAGRPEAARQAYTAALAAVAALPEHRRTTRTMEDLVTRLGTALDRLPPPSAQP